MATKTKCESTGSTGSTTIVEEPEINNQLEGTNPTGITTSSVSQKFKNCIPGNLTNQDICDLFEEHLDKNGEDKHRQECIKKIKEKRITGKSLVKICDNEQELNGLYEQLNFPYTCQICIVQMVMFIRSKHLGRFTKQENKEATTQEITDQADSKGNEKGSTSTGGVNLVSKKNVDAEVAKIITKGDGKGNVTGLKINADGDIKLKSDEINTENIGK